MLSIKTFLSSKCVFIKTLEMFLFKINLPLAVTNVTLAKIAYQRYFCLTKKGVYIKD